MFDIGIIWDELERNNDFESGYVRLRVEPKASCDIFVALKKPGNAHCLLIEVNQTSVPRGVHYPQSSCFEVFSNTLASQPINKVRLTLILKDAQYSDVFDALIWDQVKHILSKEDQKVATKEFVSRLVKWQSFFRSFSEGLSIEAQKGLYGELWFLRYVLIPKLGEYNSILSWTGPSGSNQDFQIPNCAIEIKTTSGMENNVHISNKRQLDNVGLRKLYLGHISVEAGLNGTQSLNDLIDEIKQLLHEKCEICISMFEEKLMESGYLNVHRSRYVDMKYIIREANYYDIKNNFPRIIEANIMYGIGEVHYSIDLASCETYKISFEDLSQNLLEARDTNGT
jgi:hypothetical protein